ncbi:hypothetical protein CPB84DRAFT_1855001 [Gymnopilus junonius]|uniref:Uncharacterized protein n=1 Tax=Gymnopilus junonius TaxID=109634 RepID=A0A9P5N798_GYMJU|nr:hypothetical protein CPB84DRAFT_1855001 [Gymnopilus junonius]
MPFLHSLHAPGASKFTSTGPQFSLQNAFGAGPSYGPHPQPGYLSQPLQDPLHQGADPNSPEVFKNNIRLVHQQVLELQAFARRVLQSIQNAYQTGNSPVHTEADIEALKQIIASVIERLRQSGVGALPVIPLPPDPSLPPVVPTEKELLERTTSSLRFLYEKLQRSQESAAVVANLLTTDHQPRTGSTSQPSVTDLASRLFVRLIPWQIFQS